ncbi:hypothetical protein GGR56DRAFT_634167 [Xylariaceae sp. FL0804]|nr:hypothetical protein GGR56DRAFT_634167 [Xylariaceae sp. FL0804]
MGGWTSVWVWVWVWVCDLRLASFCFVPCFLSTLLLARRRRGGGGERGGGDRDVSQVVSRERGSETGWWKRYWAGKKARERE